MIEAESRDVEVLPDLRGTRPGSTTAGWMALAVDRVAVPPFTDVRACAVLAAPDPDSCALAVEAFDLSDRAVIVSVPDSGVRIVATLSRGALEDESFELVVTLPTGEERAVPGRVEGPCRDRVVFEETLVSSDPDGDYSLRLNGVSAPLLRVSLRRGGTAGPVFATDRCAITLAPSFRSVRVEGVGSLRGGPPLLAVDADGCIHRAWSVNERRALVPIDPDGVAVRDKRRGGLISELRPGARVRDALLVPRRDVTSLVAVLTADSVHLYDHVGCPLQSPWVSGLDDAVALAFDDETVLIIQRGTASPVGSSNVRVFRLDGTELAPPAAFAGRRSYPALRNPAFVLDEASCRFRLEPGRVASGCCADTGRNLTEDESAFFRALSDLPTLRRREAWELDGTAVLGPAAPLDALDAGRPTTRWHRILLFGDIPEGCAVELRTRTSDDVLAGDPAARGAWSSAVVMGPRSAGAISLPQDERHVAGDCMVLAPPGRFLWMELRLLGDGTSTPRISAIEVERPRAGIARYLPRVYRDSTPEDDFLRRWLALFEATAFDGVAARLDGYDSLFDPRTAPERMLPFLAEWLALPVPPVIARDPARLRRILVAGPEIARLRGTAAGLRLIAFLYLGISIRIRDGFVLGSPFILGVGRAVEASACSTDEGTRGPVLGCDTRLLAGVGPTDLGEAVLGETNLAECDERAAGSAFTFDVLVAARDVCTTENLSLLHELIDLEKPAHTTYRIIELSSAGFVVGVGSIVGQDVVPGFGSDLHGSAPDPASYGIVVGHELPRPPPVGRGFQLGRSSRLTAPPGPPAFRLRATVGRTTRVTD
ncbi:MAG: phage tail protein [Myxococcota bacterium]